MKKLLVLWVLLFISKVNSQGFFDSSMHYLTISWGATLADGYGHDYYKMQLDSIASDTEYYAIFEYNSYFDRSSGKTDKKIKVSGDRIFYEGTHSKQKTPLLIYDFSLKAGDTMRVSNVVHFYSDTVLYRVDSIGQKTFAGVQYDVQYVTRLEPFHKSHYVFVRHLGSLENGVLHFASSGFEHGSELVNLCRRDTVLYWKRSDVIKEDAHTCHPVFHSGIDANNLASQPFVFPNPSNGRIKVDLRSLKEEGCVLEIFAMNGQLLKVQNVSDALEFELVGISKGLYVVRLLSPHGNRQQILSIN
jgi:hypothetical protein